MDKTGWIDWATSHVDHVRRGRLAYETFARESGAKTPWERLSERDQVAWYKTAGVIAHDVLTGCADAYERAYLAPGWVQSLRTAGDDALCRKLVFTQM